MGVIPLFLSFFFGLMVFFWEGYSWNFMAQLVAYVDGLGESSAANYGSWLVGLPIVVFVYSLTMIKDAFDVDEYNKKKLRLFWKSKKSV